MIERIFDLKEILHPGVDADYFATALSYSDDKIEISEVNPGDKLIKICFSGSEDELMFIIDKVKAKVGRDILGSKDVKVFTHNSESGSHNGDAWDDLLKSGCVFEYGRGRNGYSGLFLEIVNELDSIFMTIAKKMNAKEFCLPNFVPLEYLKRLGLVDEFPHYLFFVAPLGKNMDKIESFQKEDITDNFNFKEYLSEPRYCLKTSACSLLYPLIENKVFGDNEFFTLLGHCTRHETYKVKSFERLTEFKMREIVFIGDEKGGRRLLSIGFRAF